MKICGIIAEYNPFHEGHAYQIREAKRLSCADAVAVIMNGYFVQRGEPAVFDPYVRTEAALKAGADVVFLMPPEAGTASAELFASYGVGVLDALGCDCISCGTEAGYVGVKSSGAGGAGDKVSAINGTGANEGSSLSGMAGYADRLKEIAAKLADEDEETGCFIREKLKSGMSYPAALAAALESGIAAGPGSVRFGPNTILAVEYLKAMKRTGSSMEFVPVLRVGSGYNDTDVKDGEYPSAAALRKKMLSETKESDAAQYPGPIGPDDMLMRTVSAVSDREKELEDFADCSPQIAARLRKSRFHYKTFEEMVTDLKTKDVTYTRIARVLTHIMLGIRKSDTERMAAELKTVAECCRETGKPEKTGGCGSPGLHVNPLLAGVGNTDVLSELSRRSAKAAGCGFSIISKAADHQDVLGSTIRAAREYDMAVWAKYHIETMEFLRQKILKL